MVISKKAKIKKIVRKIPVRAKTAKFKASKVKACSKPKPKSSAKKSAAKKIGKIVHYFTKIGVAVVNLENPLRRGDYVKVLGNTTNFKQKASSIQFNRRPLRLAPRGREVGLKVNYRVRKGDEIFKLI